MLKASEVLNHLRRDSQQITGGGLVFYSFGIRAEPTKYGGVDQVGAPDGLHESFYAVSHPPLSDQLGETLLLQLPDVVVHLLARHAHTARQTRRRLGFCKLAEYLEPKRMKSGCRCSSFVDDMYGFVHTPPASRE